MNGYVRPPLHPQVFFDEAGSEIPYGKRWLGSEPPPESYDKRSHPERFAPLHDVARSLIDYLSTRYVTTVQDDLTLGQDLVPAISETQQIVRVLPADEGQAPLTFVFTTLPGVVLHAGLLHHFPLPQCDCDACDETAESASLELEWLVSAVVEGGYTERWQAGSELPLEYEMSRKDGSTRRGRTMLSPAQRERVSDRLQRLRSLPAPWRPWTPRR